MNKIPPMPDSVEFSHQAMKTTFSLRFPVSDAGRGRQVAQACFEALDRLESKLSRYIDGSDVSRINDLRAGESLFISEDCHACLLQALTLYQETGGLFDVTIGSRIEHVKSGQDGRAPDISGSLTVAPDRPLIQFFA